MPAPTDWDLQYSEYWGGRTGLTFGVREVLYSARSAFQQIRVLETDYLGRILTLDNVVQFTDHDEFVYHEMITHPALTLLRDAGKVLIIGGGDGGAAREALKHPSVTRIDLVDIDGMVAEVSKRYFPAVAAGFADPRLQLHTEDGVAFVARADAGRYDLIIVDSTDPVGIAEGLFTEAFYRDCLRALSPRGLLVVQSESPFDPNYRDTVAAVRQLFARLFPFAHTYLAFIPTYPTGMWSFTLGSRQLEPLTDYDDAAAARYLAELGPLRYYNAAVHRAAFALPEFVRELVAPKPPG